MGLAFAGASFGEWMSGSPWARVDEINGRAVRIPWECKPLCRKGGNGSERRRRGQAVRRQWPPPAAQLLRRDPELSVRVGKIVPEAPVRVVHSQQAILPTLRRMP